MHIFKVRNCIFFFTFQKTILIHWNKWSNTMIASVSFVLTGKLISNFPQTGQISNLSLVTMHEQRSNSQENSKQC